jgi:hypothetical protein
MQAYGCFENGGGIVALPFFDKASGRITLEAAINTS